MTNNNGGRPNNLNGGRPKATRVDEMDWLIELFETAPSYLAAEVFQKGESKRLERIAHFTNQILTRPERGIERQLANAARSPYKPAIIDEQIAARAVNKAGFSPRAIRAAAAQLNIKQEKKGNVWLWIKDGAFTPRTLATDENGNTVDVEKIIAKVKHDHITAQNDVTAEEMAPPPSPTALRDMAATCKRFHESREYAKERMIEFVRNHPMDDAEIIIDAILNQVYKQKPSVL